MKRTITNREDWLDGIDAMASDLLPTPMSSREFGILADAFDLIRVERLIDRGLSREDAEAMLLLVSDYFALEAAAKGGE